MVSCDYVGHDSRDHGWGGSYAKGCNLKATWSFEEAPNGTLHRKRAWVHLCTFHFNRETRGQNDWTLIRTSEPHRIT